MSQVEQVIQVHHSVIMVRTGTTNPAAALKRIEKSNLSLTRMRFPHNTTWLERKNQVQERTSPKKVTDSSRRRLNRLRKHGLDHKVCQVILIKRGSTFAFFEEERSKCNSAVTNYRTRGWAMSIPLRHLRNPFSRMFSWCRPWRFEWRLRWLPRW